MVPGNDLTESIRSHLDEKKVERRDRARARYLKGRNILLGLRQRITFVSDVLPPLKNLAQTALTQLAVALAFLAVSEALAAFLRGTGFGSHFEDFVTTATAAVTKIPFIGGQDERVQVAILAVQAAGVLLPLYFTVTASVLRGYAGAPERVRAMFLHSPVSRSYRALLVLTGIEGLIILLFAGAGWVPSGVTALMVGFFTVMALAGFLVIWFNLLRQSDPTELGSMLGQRLVRATKQVEKEFASRNDPEAIEAFRLQVASELITLRDLSAFARSQRGSRATGAKNLTLALRVFVHAYVKLAERIPKGTRWETQQIQYRSILATGGAIDTTQEQGRVVPRPSPQANPLWVEEFIGEIGAHLVAMSMQEGGEAGIDAVMQHMSVIIGATASIGRSEGALIILKAMYSSYEEARKASRPKPAVDLVLFDRLGALHAPIIDNVGDATVDEIQLRRLVETLRSDKPPRDQRVPPCGPRVREEIELVREELANERLIEGRVLTPVEEPLERFKEAEARDRLEQLLPIIKAMDEFYVRFAARLGEEESPTLLCSGTVQAFHVLKRIDRRFGTKLPQHHALDRPRFGVNDGPAAQQIRRLEERLLDSVMTALRGAKSSWKDRELPDTVGTAYYYACNEAILRLSVAPWPDFPKWFPTFLAATWKVLDLTADAGGQAAAMLSPVQEAARVSGYALLWTAVHGSKQDDAIIKGWHDSLQARKAAMKKPGSDLEKVLPGFAAQQNWLSRPRYSQRFHVDNEVWDFLLDRGLTQPIGNRTVGPTKAAEDTGNPLVLCASSEPDALHHVDDYFWAIFANRVGLALDQLPRSIRDAAANLAKPPRGE